MPALKRLHVVGCPRSGTTLITEMLDNGFHNDGCCEHEQTVYLPVDVEEGIYITKQPTDIVHIGYVLERDPDLFVVGLLRDPRGVITSIHKARENMYFCNFPVWERCWRAFRVLRGHPRFVPVRYEDLIRAPDEVQTQIADRFEFLKQKERFSRFHKVAKPSSDSLNAMGDLRAVNDVSLAKWKNHLPRLKEQLDRYPVLGEALKAENCEPDDSWMKILQGIEARRFDCRYPDYPSRIKELEKRIRIRRKAKKYLKYRRQKHNQTKEKST